MTTQRELLQALQDTAEALSTKRVRLEWIRQTVPVKPGSEEYIAGYCIPLAPSWVTIGILLGRTPGETFQILLHEAAHGYADDLNLPDREEAARELANVWHVWVKRNPQNTNELMEFLERLKGYHEENTTDRYFTWGANAGRLLPSAHNLRTYTGG